ncbi:hypothetical protein [Streptomyces meridianus]|uniref:Uncharacterized protein n=1 Tax=Streptomyces meridianus TaxID=2938945 RepID=A0ABT0XDJ3_9ACTN|nr:hypothetical protein [Streptomyces meridianus]MCM2580581.1 hypothetical protein [Streptomyces meridianus]
MTTLSTLDGSPVQHTGSTAVGEAHARHLVGDALRALRVFVSAAFRVAVLGEYAGHEGHSARAARR